MSKPNDFVTIYKLTNKIDNMIYVGQTWLQLHIRMGKNGSNYKNSLYLYNALQKYGVENFEYTILATSHNQEEANSLESKFIIELDSKNQEVGYNLKDGGSNGLHLDETKVKMSNTMIELAKSRAPDHYDCHIENKYNLGKERTPEYKEYKSEQMIEWHANNPHPMQGKHQTEEVKQSMSEKLTGREVPQEVIDRANHTRRITHELYEKELEIIKAYQDGMTVKKIFEIFGVKSNNKLYAILNAHNIPKSYKTGKTKGQKRSQENCTLMSNIKRKYWADKKAQKSDSE